MVTKKLKMSSCALPLCKNNARKGASMFRVPKNDEIATKWIDFMIENGAKNINENSRLCQDHFIFEEGKRSIIPRIGIIKMV